MISIVARKKIDEIVNTAGKFPENKIRIAQ